MQPKLAQLNLQGEEQLLSTITGINALATGVTNLYTVPTAKGLVATKFIVRVTAAAGVTGDATVSIGQNAGANDLVAATLLSNVRTTADGWVFVLSGKALLIAAAAIVKINVTIAGVGTTLTVAVDTYGQVA